MSVAVRHRDGPVDDGVHEDEAVDHSVEQAEVEPVARISRLLGRRHEAKHDRLDAAIVRRDVRVVEVSERPRLQVERSAGNLRNR
jgi:hypothetical protein